jgi:hypothetical protein
MLRGGPQASAHDKQQKQKKRLSFRDPEVEGPLRNYGYPTTGGKSKTLARPTKPTNSRKASASVEDLTLEDQALHIAQHVGSAFSDLSITDNEQVDSLGLDFIPRSVETQKETDIIDSSPPEYVAYQRSCQLRSFKITTEDEEFLDSLVPPLQDTEMRGPSFESGDQNSTKNCIPAVEQPLQEGWPTSSSTQHQIQLLRYQLEQQNQQTQMAIHQVQLLQDQVDAESTARRKAQEQNNQLMQQNKELLSHMEKLFQQIEDLEKQILGMEQERRNRRTFGSPESKAPPARQPISYTLGRRPSAEQVNEKPTQHSRNLATTNKRGSLTSTKPLASISKISASPNSTTLSASRKTPSIPSRPSAIQIKAKDFGAKDKETLRIGDTSPSVQSGIASPFGTNWKLKSPESSAQSTAEKTGTVRSRAESFSSSYVKKPQESGTAKNTLFGSSNSSISSASITGKKHSSSTSDLYNPPSAFQAKTSLMIDEPSATVKSAISNLSISSISKLPRYQPYTGWQRRTSLTSEGDHVSGVSKDSYKSSPQTSLFNR